MAAPAPVLPPSTPLTPTHPPHPPLPAEVFSCDATSAAGGSLGGVRRTTGPLWLQLRDDHGAVVVSTPGGGTVHVVELRSLLRISYGAVKGAGYGSRGAHGRAQARWPSRPLWRCFNVMSPFSEIVLVGEGDSEAITWVQGLQVKEKREKRRRHAHSTHTARTRTRTRTHSTHSRAHAHAHACTARTAHTSLAQVLHESLRALLVE